MELGGKSALILALMIAVGVLMIVARKRNFEKTRRHYTTRRQRVPVDRASEPKSASDDRSNGNPSA